MKSAISTPDYRICGFGPDCNCATSFSRDHFGEMHGMGTGNSVRFIFPVPAKIRQKEKAIVTIEAPFELPIQRAIKKLKQTRMLIRPFITNEGRVIYNVGKYNLTTEQILELYVTDRLTAEGIEKLAETCGFLSLCPYCNLSRPVSADRGRIYQELGAETDVHVTSGICGHSWHLQSHEKESLRKALKNGLI